MKLKKLFILFFLLFVYSISFAHSLTFHEHGFYSVLQHEILEENGFCHAHEHHKCETPTILCIDHGNHCDEGLFDLISCVLSDLTHHHQHDDCNLEHQSETDTKRLVSQTNLDFKILSNAINSFVFKNYKQLIQSNYQLNHDFLSPLIDCQSQRGPPCLV